MSLLRLFRRLTLPLSLGFAMLAPAAALAEPGALYLVRHGEKAAVGKDPELTPQGRLRAENVAAILGKAGITAIYSSTTQRTRQTAEPLARSSNIAVQLYDPANPKALVAQVQTVRASGANVLVVGHSNTLPELVRLFGGAPGPDILDDEYDRLYQLTGKEDSVRTVLLRSLPVTPQQ